MSQLIAHIHWWYLVFAAVVGVAVFVSANRRGELRLRSVGIAIVGLVLLLGAARFLVDTDAEKAERRTRQIVDCADKKEWDRMKDLLDRTTSLDLAGKGPVTQAQGADAIVEAVKAGAMMVGLKGVMVNSLKSEQDDTQITVTFNAITLQEATLDRPYISSWEFDWQQRQTDWRLQKIKLLSLGNEPVGR